MNIAISGSSGLIGKALATALERDGQRVLRLVRRAAQGPLEAEFNVETRRIDAEKLEGVDAVVHLAGENIAAGRWTTKQKERILASRVNGTRLLCEALAKLKTRPHVLISASAIGYYGDRGEESLTEASPSGTGFLAEVCREWEAATHPAQQAGIRVVQLRTGVVLSSDGGALPKMLTPFRLGLGGRIGSGRQYWSWIGLADLVRIIQFALQTPLLSDPVNAVAPQPVTNLEFTKTLGRVLHRPTIFPLPAFIARLMLGEMANELLLASQRVVPNKLRNQHFEFQHSDLESALRAALGR